MRKTVMLALAALCLSLSACAAAPLPEQAADGAAWSGDWVTVGNIVGVDTPEGLTPRENNSTLATRGMYYATWSMGEAADYVNADGEDVEIYDAQVYFLLAGYDAAEKAVDAAAEWQSLAAEHYILEDTEEVSCGGQDFTVVVCTYTAEDNPYARGASAYGVYRNYAVGIEVSCMEDFSGDAREILLDFLEHCHYAV